jgi:hypothetical protein
MEMDPAEVKNKLLDRRPSSQGDPDEAVKAIVRKVLGDGESMNSLESNMPLSILLMKSLHRVLGIRNMNTTLRAHDESMSYYIGRGLLHNR